MTQPQQGFAIGVDLGTSNTVAVIRHPDGRTRPLLVDGAPIMPSGVYVDEHGRLHVGRDAQRMAGLDPSRFEPNPKRRIDEPAVLLGDREIATVDLLAAILAAVARAAVEAVGFLPAAVLTHPAAWGGPRREALAEAARRAGWPPVKLVPEPVAAARYFADVLRRPVPVGGALAVYDFGGGTLDVAVVRNDGGRFTVIASGGIEDLGGLDVDAAIVEHLSGFIGPAPFLVAPQTTTQRRDRRLFWDDVRGAKEMLSRTTVAPITVPGRDQALHLTREELERVTEPLIRRSVWHTGHVIHSAGLRPDQLAGLFLVGGSSRLPLAARLLHADLGIAPTVLEQPELPVAEGALAELIPNGYVTESIPVAPPTAPVPPVSPAFSGVPVSAPPVMAPPVVPPVRRRPTALLVAVAAAVVVLALVAAGGYWFFFRDRINAVDFKTVTNAGELALGGDDSAITYPVGATLGSRTYAGWYADKAFHLVAYDLDDKKKAWAYDLTTDTYRWTLYPNAGGLILVGDGGTKGTLRLLNNSNGKERAQMDFSTSADRVLFLDSVFVVHSGAAKKSSAYAWDGAPKWSIDDDKKGTIIRGPVNAADERGPADFNGDPTNRDTKSRTTYVSVDGDKINLRDAGDGGKILRSWNDSADSYAEYYMADDRLFVYGTSYKYTVKVYDLTKQSEPDQLYAGDDKHRVLAFATCGAGRVCVLDYANSDGSDTNVHGLSIAEKKELWKGEAKGADTLVPVGKQILATDSRNGSSSRLYGEDGKQLLKQDDQGTFGVRVTNGSLLFFGKAPSPYPAALSLVGVTASSGERVALGTLPKVASSSCSWNATKIACLAGAKLQVWDFA
ncbi:Hsp70 family protein [Dactylosporangium sp. CA-139066]|uniref:Hsp70 family protein n=1 Tax=Dactylosporangium sp. CA-139066 TaxID=3239930 RepID=UPI003D8B04D1